MKLLINKIKEKKSLKNLDDEIVKDTIRKYLDGNVDLTNPKSASFKDVLKQTRNELNRIYGCFMTGDELDLKSHSSTRERLLLYPTLYKDIFKITGKPKSILDISAGFNPLSYKYLTCKPKYLATELTKIDTTNLNKWFKQNKILGKAIQKNITKDTNFPKTDITFIFKTLDLLNYKLAEEIITNLKSEYAIISFSTKTLNNIQMRHPHRGWLERMLERLKIQYTKLEYPNEIFYIINLSK